MLFAFTKVIGFWGPNPTLYLFSALFRRACIMNIGYRRDIARNTGLPKQIAQVIPMPSIYFWPGVVDFRPKPIDVGIAKINHPPNHHKWVV